jgi:probable phosphoglycerate mutase
VRHGEAVCNAESTLGGPIGCRGLTELGRSQARALAVRLSMSGELGEATALYSSTLPRAVETAALLSPSLPAGLATVVREDLCEIDPGEADGMRWDQFIEVYGVPDWDSDPTVPLTPGGESWTGFYERCRVALTELAERHAGELAVIVCHGGVVEQALKLVQDAGAGARLRLRTENCSMTEVEHRDGRWYLLRYNDRAPLPRELSAPVL